MASRPSRRLTGMAAREWDVANAASDALKRRGVRYLKRLLWRVVPQAFDSIAPHRGQTFSIGIYAGTSPLSLADPSDVHNPVLTRDQVTDVPAGFVADPFMLRRDDRWYMFMEVFNRLNRRGEIGLATSEDARRWKYDRVVLREYQHLAYPCLFQWQDDTYMIPDSPGRGTRLYRASPFPYTWQFERQLLAEKNLCDSTIFRHDDRWWILAGWADRRGEPLSLRLFGADELDGEWAEHPQSPVRQRDDGVVRPAGPVVQTAGRMFRLAQDCSTSYGTRVRAFEILELTPERYVERPVDSGVVVEAGDSRWHSGGMHHVNAHEAPDGQWIACVDGWIARNPDRTV